MEETGYATLNNDHLVEICNMLLNGDKHIALPTHKEHERPNGMRKAERLRLELIRREIAEA